MDLVRELKRPAVCIAAFLLCAATFLAADTVRAEEKEEVKAPEADDVRVETPAYRPAFAKFDPPRGHYEYTVAWQGIPAATLTVNVERENLQYRVVTTAETYSGIDLFYKLRYRAEGLVSAIDYRPLRTVIDQRENSKVKNTQITFRNDGKIFSVYTRKGKGSKVFDFDPQNFTLEPFSAAFLARSLHWNVGDTKHFDTFNGKSRYLISLTAEDRIEMEVNGEKKNVFVISPKVKKLTAINPRKKLREARIYVTDDKARDILQIESEVFIGTVTTTLTSFTPSSRPEDGMRLAGRKQEISVQ